MVFTTSQVKELCAAMQAGKAWGDTWAPPSTTERYASGTLRLAKETVRMDASELPKLIARLQRVLGPFEKPGT